MVGIRSATSAPQEALIKRAIEVFQADDRVLAAYLVGGFAVGTGDPWSDVDLQCIIADEAMDDLTVLAWPELANAIATAHTHPFGFNLGGVCITPEWLHFDLVVTPRSAVDPKTLEGMVPVVDKEGLLPSGSVPRPDRQGAPFFPGAAVQFFLYMLGNMVSVIGRKRADSGQQWRHRGERHRFGRIAAGRARLGDHSGARCGETHSPSLSASGAT